MARELRAAPMKTASLFNFAKWTVLLILWTTATAQASGPNKDLFPLTQDRFGTLGCPPDQSHWDLIGARWFKSGDCYWQADWVSKSNVQAWLLVRPRMYFTGNNRVWNPAPGEPKWQYRDKTRKFIQDNHARIGIIAVPLLQGDRQGICPPQGQRPFRLIFDGPDQFARQQHHRPPDSHVLL